MSNSLCSCGGRCSDDRVSGDEGWRSGVMIGRMEKWKEGRKGRRKKERKDRVKDEVEEGKKKRRME